MMNNRKSNASDEIIRFLNTLPEAEHIRRGQAIIDYLTNLICEDLLSDKSVQEQHKRRARKASRQPSPKVSMIPSVTGGLN
jgi:hypothetical protein